MCFKEFICFSQDSNNISNLVVPYNNNNKKKASEPCELVNYFSQKYEKHTIQG